MGFSQGTAAVHGSKVTLTLSKGAKLAMAAALAFDRASNVRR